MFFVSDDPLFSDEELLLMCAASGGKTVEDTATGNPLTFTTDIAKPLKSLLIPVTPKQEGTGDPSPQNIRSILPWNGLTVFGGGKNLLSLDRTEGTLSGDASTTQRIFEYNKFYKGLAHSNYVNTKKITDFSIDTQNQTVSVTSDGVYGVAFPIPCIPGEKISFSMKVADDESTLFRYNFYAKDGTYISNASVSPTNRIVQRTFTVPEGAFTVCFIFISPNGESRTFSEIMLNVGESFASYETPRPITDIDIVFPSPVYGGTLDVVTGVLTVEWEIVDMGSLRWVANATGTTGIYRMSTSSLSDNIEIPSANSVPGKIVCSAYKTISADNTYSKVGGIAIGRNKAVTVYDADYNTDGSVDDFITSVTGKMIAYKLETPQEIQLTPTQITALVGDNTIWSDADGSMTAVYLKKG